ncbi:MAG TPA: hypothetical protein VKI61_04295 [Chitinophagaceae bacterium]|jgi:hypothetical protein|nr:hypothetical protein [Chitinophagaceae bacterium]
MIQKIEFTSEFMAHLAYDALMQTVIETRSRRGCDIRKINELARNAMHIPNNLLSEKGIEESRLRLQFQALDDPFFQEYLQKEYARFLSIKDYEISELEETEEPELIEN